MTTVSFRPLLHTSKKDGRPKKPWWPEEAALAAKLVATWKTHSKDVRAEVKQAFDWSGKQVDAHRVMRALDGFQDTAQQWANAVLPTARKLLTKVDEKSVTHYTVLAENVLGTASKTDVLTWLLQRTLDQVELFMLRHADRMLLPELERLVRAFQASAAADTLDIGYFQQRLDRIMQQEAYLQGLSSYYTAREWNAQAILLAQTKGINTYTITNPLDQVTCPVCMHLYGKTYSVSVTLARIEKEFSITNPDELKSQYPFPRLADVDNISYDELVAKGFNLPPYHNRCRCEVVFLGTSDVHSTTDISVLGAMVGGTRIISDLLGSGGASGGNE